MIIPSLEELMWGMFGRCIACRNHPALGPLGFCGVCFWENVIEVQRGMTLLEAMLAEVPA